MEKVRRRSSLRRGGRLSLPIAIGALALLLISVLPLEAFFPTNARTGFGAFGTSHQKMSQQAVEALDSEFFGITKLTKPMKKAIEQIEDGNIQVDDDQQHSAKHFDGENFAGGEQFIDANRKLVLSTLKNDDGVDARFYLGSALHTIQDFYAHSNWVDLGNGGPNGSLGVPGSVPGPSAGPTEATCQDCILPPPGTDPPPPLTCPFCDDNVITSKLTSGYYGGEDRVKPSPAKCSHGGLTDGSAGPFGFGINKDSFLCQFSPHASRHSAAANVAREATKKFIREIKADVTTRQLKLLLGVGPSLAFAIDTTGSMGSIIDGVKQQAIAIVDARIGTDEEPSQYVLAPFNDPDVGPVQVTTDPDAFKGGISGLFASGGGDCPELSNSGMLQALSAGDEGGSLFMFTDASSKDGGLAGAVSSLATSKDIKVFPITFGSCSPLDPAYIQIADESGGQVFELQRSEAGQITRLADFVVRSNAVDVLSVAGALAAPQSFTAPVDSTMSRVTFSVSGTTAVTLTRPDGSVVAASDPGVSFVSLSTGALYSIVDPAHGNWTISLGASSRFSLTVSGESELNLSSFRFVEPGGRPGHDGLFPIPGLPIRGVSNTALAVMSGSFASVGFELRTKSGTVLQPLDLSQRSSEAPEEYSGDVTLPDTPFLVYATGQDASGLPFQRLVSATVRAQPVKIAAPLSQTLTPGATTTYSFQVTNVGAADDFSFSAADDRRFVAGVSPQFFHLEPGATQTVAVTLAVPAGTASGTPDSLTVTVQSTTGTGAHNFAIVRSVVAGDTTPPTISSLTATPSQLWPPNHKLVAVHLSVVATDDQDPHPVCGIAAVSSNEPSGPDPDWVFQPGSLDLQLRADRDGNGTGRIYTIAVDCSDASGNVARATVDVTVPHDQSGP